MRRLLLVPFCFVGFACQTSQYVTHDQMRDLLALPPAAAGDGAAGGLGAEDRRQQLDLLVGETFAAPDASTRAAAALTVAGQRTAQLNAALSAIELSYNVCAVNLANLETTAYKASYAVRDPGGAPHFRIDFEQGSLQSTGRQLDLGISGQGFFKVKLRDSVADGVAYTRNGNFFVNREGSIVLGMGDGYELQPEIVVPKGATDVSIDQDGRVEVVKSGQNVKLTIGRLELAQFVNPQGLNPLGGSLYTQTEVSGPPAVCNPGDGGAGQVLQGFLEGSNVDSNRERLRMRFLQNWRATILKVIDEMR